MENEITYPNENLLSGDLLMRDRQKTVFEKGI